MHKFDGKNTVYNLELFYPLIPLFTLILSGGYQINLGLNLRFVLYDMFLADIIKTISLGACMLVAVSTNDSIR